MFASRRVHAPKSPRHSSQASLERGPSSPGRGDTPRLRWGGEKRDKAPRGWHLPGGPRGDARGRIPPPTAAGCSGVPEPGRGVPPGGGGSRPALGLARLVGNLVNQVSGAPAPPIQPPLQPHPCPAKPWGDEETLLYSHPAAQASPELRHGEEGAPRAAGKAPEHPTPPTSSPRATKCQQRASECPHPALASLSPGCQQTSTSGASPPPPACGKDLFPFPAPKAAWQRVPHHSQDERSGSAPTPLGGCPGGGCASGAAAFSCINSSQRLFHVPPPPQLRGEAPRRLLLSRS